MAKRLTIKELIGVRDTLKDHISNMNDQFEKLKTERALSIRDAQAAEKRYETAQEDNDRLNRRLTRIRTVLEAVIAIEYPGVSLKNIVWYPSQPVINTEMEKDQTINFLRHIYELTNID